MSWTFPGIQENWGRHVSIAKSEGGTRHCHSEWSSPKTILLLIFFFKCIFHVSLEYTLIGINV
jgi:hypothetical protein